MKIIVKLKGGLGNQMFQYAFGKEISLLTNRELILDLSISKLILEIFNKLYLRLILFAKLTSFIVLYNNINHF